MGRALTVSAQRRLDMQNKTNKVRICVTHRTNLWEAPRLGTWSLDPERLSVLPKITQVAVQIAALVCLGEVHLLCPKPMYPPLRHVAHYSGTNAFSIEGYPQGILYVTHNLTDHPPTFRNTRVFTDVLRMALVAPCPKSPSLLEFANTRHQGGLNHDLMNFKERCLCFRYRVAHILAAKMLLVIWGESVR